MMNAMQVGKKMRVAGIILGLLLLIAVLTFVAVKVLRYHQYEAAKQLVREDIEKNLPRLLAEEQKKSPDPDVDSSISVKYPDIRFEMNMLTLNDTLIMDSVQTAMTDRMMQKEVCKSILDPADSTAEDFYLALQVIREERLSVTMVLNNAAGYQIYSKKFFVTECPEFDSMYKHYAA